MLNKKKHKCRGFYFIYGFILFFILFSDKQTPSSSKLVRTEWEYNDKCRRIVFCCRSPEVLAEYVGQRRVYDWDVGLCFYIPKSHHNYRMMPMFHTPSFPYQI